MEGKEIKSLLKQAREAIKEKDFKEALKHCKAVLKIDKNNYNAWVFVGAAAQELEQFEQSEAAFKKAIEISHDQLLAWQGLCNFYEKYDKEKHISDLLPVYKKLIELFPDQQKKLEVYDKLITCVQSLNDTEMVIKVMKSKYELVKGDSCQEYTIQKQIFKLLVNKKSLSSFEKECLTEAIKGMISTNNTDDCKNCLIASLNSLDKNEDELFSSNLVYMIYLNYPDDSCLESLCRTAMNLYLEKDMMVPYMCDLLEKLEDINTKGITRIFQGFVALISKKYVSAIEKINEGLKSLEYYVQGWYFLSLSQLNLHIYSDCIKSCRKGIEMCNKLKGKSNLIGKFYLLLGQGLCGIRLYDSAIKSIEKSLEYLGQSKELMITFCRTLLKIGQLDKAEKICNNLKSEISGDAEVLQLEGYLYLLKKDHSNALTILRQSMAVSELPFTLHLIGILLWDSGQREKAYKVFFKAVELDPYLAQNFLYLGHYYQHEKQDKHKAAICYNKAFNLDCTDVEIGVVLSQTLKDLGKDDENMKVLKTITENVSLESCKWAWMQLGLYQLEKNLCSEAILSLQNAVRAEPNNSCAWECLADAYLRRGSYESALKAFERASEINASAMYPLYQIATIQKMRGMFSEAIEKYKDLLNLVSTYIPALIGLSETLVLLAKKFYSECLYGLSRDYFQEALKTLARVAATHTGLSCLWKLAGDATSYFYNFDDIWLPIVIPKELHQEPEKEDISCGKVDTLMFSSKFFGRAVAIKKDVSTLWHDLGTSYYYQAIINADGSQKVDFSKKAFICFQKAVSLSPNCEAHWIALGVTALRTDLKDYAFGQHALIKSLNLNANNAESWTNLGVLYLENNNLQLSNAAFQKAQSSEPTYSLSWIGQAIIADKVKHRDSIDLYRHAITLGSHKEALIGYSRVICEALLNELDKESAFYKYNIQLMNAIVTASDCSLKFVANQHDCPKALNILGMLLERQKIYSAALKAYKRALDLLQEEDSDLLEVIRLNYARILSCVGFANEAINQFIMLKKKDVSFFCSLALTFFKAKQYENAYKTFQQAFKMSNDNNKKSHIMVAMAMVSQNLQSDDISNPLTLLFQSSQLKPASVPGLLALCASGILKDEKKLTLAAQNELVLYKYNKDFSCDIAFLYAAKEFIQKGPRAGRNELLKFLHCLPNNGTLWLLVASCLLEWDRKYASDAVMCTNIGVFHGGCKEDASQIFALCKIADGYRKGTLSAAQKAVHINPAKLSNWITLAAACHVADTDRKSIGWMFGFVKKMAKDQGSINPQLLGVLIVLEAYHHILTDNLSVAANLISKALHITAFNSEVQSALQVLNAVVKVLQDKGNLEPLVSVIKSNPKSFLAWHVLSQLLLSSDKFIEAEKFISQFVQTAEKFFCKWVIFPLLQLAVLSYRAMHVKNEECAKWLKLGEDVSGKAVHLAPTSQAARFLQGLFAVESGNKNLARRSFEKVLMCSTKEPKWIEYISDLIMEKLNLRRKDITVKVES